MKGAGFDQYSSPFLAANTLRLIINVSAAYHITISILDVTDDFHNNLKASSKREIIDCPHHYTSWFKVRFSTICIEPASNVISKKLFNSVSRVLF